MKYDIGLEEALSITLERLTRLAPIDIEIYNAVGLTVAEDCIAAVNCPSASSSMKDGFAVVSEDLENASKDNPVKLKVTSSVFAGRQEQKCVVPATAIKIMTGGTIPQGADAVIASEFTEESGDGILCYRDAGCGRNILSKGQDVKKGDHIACTGEVLTPAKTGLMAAAGIASVRVYPRPRVGIIAIGDEVVKPGESLEQGQLYASNIVTLTSWLKRFHINAQISIVPDVIADIRSTIETMLEHVDVILTSGGVWKSERDLTVKTIQDLGGEVVFHHLRMGPGKAAAAIVLRGKTVFCLPGGPPSNEMAFLQIALPSILHLMGKEPLPFEYKTATLTETLRGESSWTQFYHATTAIKDGQLFVEPLKIKSRLKSQSMANSLIKIPEGVECLKKQEQIQIQILHTQY